MSTRSPSESEYQCATARPRRSRSTMISRSPASSRRQLRPARASAACSCSRFPGWFIARGDGCHDSMVRMLIPRSGRPNLDHPLRGNRPRVTTVCSSGSSEMSSRRCIAPPRRSPTLGFLLAGPRYQGTMFHSRARSTRPVSCRAHHRFSAVASLLSEEMNPDPARPFCALVIGPGASRSSRTRASMPASAGSTVGISAGSPCIERLALSSSVH